MAPVGNFSNYKRRPRGLLVLDRSLSETSPGAYTTPVRLPSAGRFDVPVLVDQPRTMTCFQLDVNQSPETKSAHRIATAVKPRFAGRKFTPGQPATLAFLVTDPVTRRPLTGLGDVQVYSAGWASAPDATWP